MIDQERHKLLWLVGWWTGHITETEVSEEAKMSGNTEGPDDGGDAKLGNLDFVPVWPHSNALGGYRGLSTPSACS